MRRLVRETGFHVAYVPGEAAPSESPFAAFFADPDRFIGSFHHDVRAATDDRPFFFYTLNLLDALRFWSPETRTENIAYFSLVVSLGLLIILAVGLDRFRQSRAAASVSGQ